MSILLEGTNNDCKEIGIETIEEYKLRKWHPLNDKNIEA